MKKIIITILIIILSFLALTITAQITEDFNPPSTWTFTNGAGIQNYGPPDNFATFNLGTAPYVNNAEITITSPTYHFDNCGFLVITFPLTGVIEASDTLSLQYLANNTWITITKFTSYYTNPFAVYNAPSTANQFRFVLKTDGPKIKYYPRSLNQDSAVLVQDSLHPIAIDESNTYVAGRPVSKQVYYYDISSFKIECGISLPITLKLFSATKENKINFIKWVTASETNNHFFILEKSEDGIHFCNLKTRMGAGTTSTQNDYSVEDKDPYPMTYYRLRQVDYNGNTTTSEIISCYNHTASELLKITNIHGNEVEESYNGLLFYWYSDGSIIKRIIIK